MIIQGGLQQPPLGKYVWEKPSGEQGLSESEYLVCGMNGVLIPWAYTTVHVLNLIHEPLIHALYTQYH